MIKLLKNIEAKLHKTKLNAKYVLAGDKWCVALMRKRI